jgi:hypothetical protein
MIYRVGKVLRVAKFFFKLLNIVILPTPRPAGVVLPPVLRYQSKVEILV